MSGMNVQLLHPRTISLQTPHSITRPSTHQTPAQNPNIACIGLPAKTRRSRGGWREGGKGDGEPPHPRADCLLLAAAG
eukprot:4196660-Prorocentrum_lima.AAC.1